MSVPSIFQRRNSQEAAIVPQQQKRLRKKSDRDRGRRQRGGTSSEDEGVSGILLWQKNWKNRPGFGEAQNDHDMSDDLYDVSPVRKQDVIMREHEDKRKNRKKDESDGTGYISDEEDDRAVEVEKVDVPMEENNLPSESRNDMRMEVDSD